MKDAKNSMKEQLMSVFSWNQVRKALDNLEESEFMITDLFGDPMLFLYLSNYYVAFYQNGRGFTYLRHDLSKPGFHFLPPKDVEDKVKNFLKRQ